MTAGHDARGDGFEPKDANTRAIGYAMAIGVAIIAVSVAGLFALIGIWHRADRAGPPLTREQSASIVPPGPPLQGNPLDDIAVLRKRESAELAAYRWLGADHAAAQVPIARAMAMVVGDPLDPMPPPSAPPQATP